MSGIPVKRFYSATRRKPARSVINLKTRDNKSHQPVANDNDLFKARSVSTSTPLVNRTFHHNELTPTTNKLRRSLSAGTISYNDIDDSGYADSLAESTLCTPLSMEIVSSSTNYGVQNAGDKSVLLGTETPVCSSESLFHIRHGIMSEFSPVDERFHLRGSLSRENDITLDFIQSDWEIPEEENVFEKFRLNGSFQEFDSNPKSRLNFESDFDDDDEIDYINSSHTQVDEHGLSEIFNAVLKKFSPPEPDRLIGRKMGLSCVDILAELNFRNINCVFDILDYLEPKDLCSLCLVSRGWKTICDSSVRNTRRRRNFLRRKRIGSHRPSPVSALSTDTGSPTAKSKENLDQKPKAGGSRGLTDSKQHSQVLATIQSVGQGRHSTPVTVLKQQHNLSARQDLFNSAASSLKNDESLQKCPKCQFPSRVLPVQERGQCTAESCGFDYCINCLNEFHSARSCAPVTAKRKTDPIGGRKSKKNLRRL